MALKRRDFLGQLSALGTGMAICKWAEERVDGLSANESEFIIRNAIVLTIDPELGDLNPGDVHVKNGRIENVGSALKITGVQEIDGRGKIVLPGLVETHWHVWTSVMRALAGAKMNVKYFDITSKLGPLFSPDDMYTSSRLAYTEAIHSGITYVHDWCHNVRTGAHARASLQAVKDAGIRGRFSVGLPAGASQEQALDLLLAKELQKENSSIDRVQIGIALPEAGSNPPTRSEEVSFARKHQMPMSVHAGRKSDGSDSIEKIMGLLDKDVQIIHAVKSTKQQIELAAKKGASFSVSPFSELRIGYGFPPLPDMLASSAAIGLSVDTFPLSGNADMFAVMKVALNIANAISLDELQPTGRRILEIATIEGARSMGMDRQIGSISRKKKADLIILDTRQPNMMPLIDPVMQVVTAAQPANVDAVIVNGKFLKKDGKVLQADTAEINGKANALAMRLRMHAG